MRAREAKLADLSDVAVLKRLRKSKDWLHELCHQLLQEQAAFTRKAAGLSLRLVDATLVQEPGATGSSRQEPRRASAIANLVSLDDSPRLDPTQQTPDPRRHELD